MNHQENEQDLRKANIRTALILGVIALSSLVIAAYGVSKTFAVGG